MKIKGIRYKEFSNFIKQESLLVGDEVWICDGSLRYRRAKVTAVHKDGIYTNHHKLKRVKLKWTEDGHYECRIDGEHFKAMNSSERRHWQTAYRIDNKNDKLCADKSRIINQNDEW